MELYVSLCKPIITTDEDSEDFILLEEAPELAEIFKDFIVERVSEIYDLDKAIEDYGYTPEDVEYEGYMIGDDAKFYYRIVTHDLYAVSEYLSSIEEVCSFATEKELFDSGYYKKFLKFLPLLMEFGYNPNYKFRSEDAEACFCLRDAYWFASKMTSLTILNPDTMSQIEEVIYYEDISEHWGVADKLFLDDDMFDSPCVVSKEVLIEHWNRYFSHQTPDSKGGYGSNVEYEMTDDEMRKEFKENIVDKFIEGEHFVIYC